MATRKVSRRASTENIERISNLTAEVFPNLLWIFRERLIWDFDKIFTQYERAISRIVAKVLKTGGSSDPTKNGASLIFDAVIEMGAELFCAALERTARVFQYDVSKVDYEAAAVYQDVLNFTSKKYESAVSEIPGLVGGGGNEPTLKDALNLEWENAKCFIRECSGVVDREPRHAVVLKRPTKALKPDETLPGGRRLVSFATTERFLRIGSRQRLKLIRDGLLQVESMGTKRKITTESLLQVFASKSLK